MSKIIFFNNERFLISLSLIIFTIAISKAQRPCFDLSYDVTVMEYRTVNKGVQFTDVLSVDYPKFVHGKYFKKVNKYFDDQNNAVILESINNHEKYFPIAMKLPLISIYGNATERRLQNITNGRYDPRTNNYTILNQYNSFSFDPSIHQKGFLKGMSFLLPSAQEISLLIQAGWHIENSPELLRMCSDSVCISFDKVNLTQTEDYFLDKYSSCTYYKRFNSGDTLKNHTIEVLGDTLTNGLCSQVTVITTFENYQCGVEPMLPRSEQETTEESDLMTYPNPSNGLLIIEIPAEFKNKEAEIIFTDIQGQILKSSKRILDTEKLFFNLEKSFKTEGLYFINVVSEGKNLVSKFYYSQSK